jgi:hypothetical protein
VDAYAAAAVGWRQGNFLPSLRDQSHFKSWLLRMRRKEHSVF